MNTVLEIIYQFTQRDYIAFFILLFSIPLLLLLISAIFSITYSKKNFLSSFLILTFPLFFFFFQLIWKISFKSEIYILLPTLLQLGILYLFIFLLFRLFSQQTYLKLIYFSLILLLVSTPFIYLNTLSLFPTISFVLSFLFTTIILAIFSKDTD